MQRQPVVTNKVIMSFFIAGDEAFRYDFSLRRFVEIVAGPPVSGFAKNRENKVRAATVESTLCHLQFLDAGCVYLRNNVRVAMLAVIYEQLIFSPHFL